MQVRAKNKFGLGLLTNLNPSLEILKLLIKYRLACTSTLKSSKCSGCDAHWNRHSCF